MKLIRVHFCCLEPKNSNMPYRTWFPLCGSYAKLSSPQLDYKLQGRAGVPYLHLPLQRLP